LLFFQMIAVMVQVLLFWIFVCLTTIQVSSQILPHFPLLEFSSLPLNNNKLLALTFDDGPDKVGATRAILNVLNTHHVPGTFFINSNNALNINNSPESQQLLRQIVASGHELASHSETHRDLAVIPEAQIEGELINVQKAVDNALANTNLISPRLTHFRAPYGSPFQNPSLYPDEKLRVISSTVGKYSIHIGWVSNALHIQTFFNAAYF
jgi:peptidoglycan/xylan/chitin deacetylase (PgdA/CDA1 family)